MQDLVYVKYNQALSHRFETRDVVDPILLDDIDHSNEWLVGEMGSGEHAEDDLVFDDDIDNNMTWGDVANVAGVSEPLTYTRRTRQNVAASAPTSSRGKGPLVEVEEEEVEVEVVEVEEEREEDIYSCADEDDEGETDLDLEGDDD